MTAAPKFRKYYLLIYVVCIITCFQVACTPQNIPSPSPENSGTNSGSPLSSPNIQYTQSSFPEDLTPNQITTLTSLQKIDDYPLYTMDYEGAYKQINFTSELEGIDRQNIITTRKLPDWGCSLFAALGAEGDYLFGRNFDWEYSPGLLLFSDPPDGYASASMVDIAYMDFEDQVLGSLTDLPVSELIPLLDAPYWPFDGMNENGLAIGMAAVPAGQVKPNPEKPTIGSLQVMRKILDQAVDINQAISILENYNIDFRDGPALHYLIADSSGEAVLVEFFQGEMHLIPNNYPWHQATNFLYSSVEDPQGYCRRYDKISNRMLESGGNLTTDNAMDLLSSVSQNNTQWSVLYHLNSGNIDVTMGELLSNFHRFQLIP